MGQKQTLRGAAKFQLFDHLVGNGEQVSWHLYAKRSRRLQVDGQYKFGRLQHRHVGGLGALEDAARIDADLTIHVLEIGSVTHQPASRYRISVSKSRRNLVARGEGDKLHGTANEKPVWSNEEGIGAVARKAGKGRINLADRRGVNNCDLQPKSVGGFLYGVQRSLGVGNIGGVNEYGNANGLRYHVVQEPQPLGYHLGDKKIDACRIATGPSKVGDKTKPDRVLGDAEDNRDGCCRSFGREYSGRAAGNGDHGHLSVD